MPIINNMLKNDNIVPKIVKILTNLENYSIEFILDLIDCEDQLLIEVLYINDILEK